MAHDYILESDLWRAALETIARHYEGCDLDGDDSAKFVLRRAVDALGWSIEYDDDRQIVLIRG